MSNHDNYPHPDNYKPTEKEESEIRKAYNDHYFQGDKKRAMRAIEGRLEELYKLAENASPCSCGENHEIEAWYDTLAEVAILLEHKRNLVEADWLNNIPPLDD